MKTFTEEIKLHITDPEKTGYFKVSIGKRLYEGYNPNLIKVEKLLRRRQKKKALDILKNDMRRIN